MFQLVSYLYERETVTLYETVPSANLLSRFTIVNALNLDDQKTALSKNIFSNKLLNCMNVQEKRPPKIVARMSRNNYLLIMQVESITVL